MLDKIAASSQFSAELAKRAASEEIRAQMKSEAPAVRAKLDTLIERKAEAIAGNRTGHVSEE